MATLRAKVPAFGRQYVLPVLLVGLALWVTRLAAPLARHTPHLLPLLGVILSARIGGRRAAILSTALSAAAGWPIHLWTVGPDGSEHAVATVVYAGVALYVGLSVATHQATEAALAETDARLLRTNETLSALIDASPIPIISIDASDRVLMWSRAAAETFGWTPQEVVGRPYPLVPEGHEEEHRAFAERVLHGETFANIETKRRRRDGTMLDVIIATAPIRNRDGVIDRTLGMLFDTTTRHRAEQELRASEERYRSLFSAIHEGVVLHELVRDREGRPIDYRILSANPGFETNSGLPVEAVIGRLASEAYGNGTAPYLEQYAAVVESGAPVTFETTFAPMRRTFSISAYKTGDDGFATVFQDLTERRRLEQQFRQAQKMEAIGRLAGGVAHDFNNLLTAILGFSELALADLPPDSGARRDIEEIKKAGETAAAVTRELLAFSRRQILRPEVIDLNAHVAQRERFLARLIGEDIRVVVTPAPEPAMARVDPNQIEQVIMNLAVNARDAMPEGGVLTIDITHVELDAGTPLQPPPEPGRYVCLGVSDTGHGMSAEVRAHLFEPFFTTKERGKGTGLGLATVYGIVKQSGGHIWAYGEVGQGATFKVYLPAASEGVEAVRTETPRGDRASGTETILLVEDEPPVRELVGEILERAGYTVLQAAGAESAVRACQAYPDTIHLLLTDVVMPGVSGSALAERLRQERAHLRVLFMSGYTDDAIGHRGFLDQATAFIQKPFSARALAEKVREALEQPAPASPSQTVQ